MRLRAAPVAVRAAWLARSCDSTMTPLRRTLGVKTTLALNDLMDLALTKLSK